MYEALKELMKDEIDRTVNEAVDKKEKKTAINMLKENEPLSKITKYTELSSEAVIELAKSIGVSVV
ncbi:MAG: hypothetical protein IJV15_11855 [Lachnospiraceae bacterium]|nr:hypothetical protein [Lachnospiraceae bacterium]